MNKTYIVIGHWNKFNSTTSIALQQSSIANVRIDCRGNGFIPYVIMSEDKAHKLINMDDAYDVYEAVKRMTSNYRVHNEVAEYIRQCGDFMVEKMEAAK